MGIQVVFKFRRTLRQLLMNVKISTQVMNKKEVVYQTPWQDCDSVSIGETGRSLGKRICSKDWNTGRIEWLCMHGTRQRVD